MTPYAMRDEIFKTLVQTYNHGGNTNWFHRDADTMCKSATIDILTVVAYDVTHTERDRDLFQEIRNVLWNYFPGGTTAAHCAAKIVPLFNVEVPDLRNY